MGAWLPVNAFGPFQKKLWKSPLRGPWMAGFLGTALLVLISICALTGFLSHAAYDPNLKGNAIVGEGGGFNFYFFDWPSSPAWLYALNQSLHVLSGLAAIPILLAKLWTVIPKLFEWPTLRSPLHGLYRLSLALLVGGSLFVMFTGVQNVAYWYPWGFGFVPAHYYAAQIFMAVNGADLSPDHGFPARIIVPALPGVHNTKWVARMAFNAQETKA